jgi:hypothetical protein
MPPYARASSLNSTIHALFCAMFRLFGEPSHKMRSLRIPLGDPALPPTKKLAFHTGEFVLLGLALKAKPSDKASGIPLFL